MNQPNSGARRRNLTGRTLAIVAGTALLGGCVQIQTPDKPIEINLNINIRQEIVYRLDGDAKKLIEQNSEIF